MNAYNIHFYCLIRKEHPAALEDPVLQCFHDKRLRD